VSEKPEDIDTLRVSVDGVDIIIPPEERTRCEVWTRVMGYFRPIAYFNVGKKKEYEERVNYMEPQ